MTAVTKESRGEQSTTTQIVLTPELVEQLSTTTGQAINLDEIITTTEFTNYHTRQTVSRDSPKRRAHVPSQQNVHGQQTRQDPGTDLDYEASISGQSTDKSNGSSQTGTPHGGFVNPPVNLASMIEKMPIPPGTSEEPQRKTPPVSYIFQKFKRDDDFAICHYRGQRLHLQTLQLDQREANTSQQRLSSQRRPTSETSSTRLGLTKLLLRKQPPVKEMKRPRPCWRPTRLTRLTSKK